MAAITDNIPGSDQDQQDQGPMLAPKEERAATEHVARALKAPPTGPVRLVTADGQTIELPATLLHVLRLSADLFAHDRAVLLDSLGPHLSPEQAAEILGFPLDYVMKLLDSGELPSEREGNAQRLLVSDVLEYRQVFKLRHEALDELTRLSEEMGLYDLDTSPAKPRRLMEYENDDQTGKIDNA
jgi:excisionase family DNA binding protein